MSPEGELSFVAHQQFVLRDNARLEIFFCFTEYSFSKLIQLQ